MWIEFIHSRNMILLLTYSGSGLASVGVSPRATAAVADAIDHLRLILLPCGQRVVP